MLKDDLIGCVKEAGAECAFVIKNLKTGETFEYQENLVVPSASLIKIFILICAMKQVKEGKLAMDGSIRVEKDDVVPFSVLEFLKPRAYGLEELLNLMIVYSDNTATNVLVDFLGLDKVKECIEELGYEKSVLQRKMMDFDGAREGRQNLTSAGEMADVLEGLHRGKLLGQPYDQRMLDIMKGQCDEDMMRAYLPDELVIARKSGELDCLNHDIALVYTGNGEYIYVFFVWDGSSNNVTREILGKTSKMVFDSYENGKW